MLNLGNQPGLHHSDLKSVSCPCCLILGDKDKMVSIEETLAIYKAMPNCSLAILPQTAHPIEQISIDLLQCILLRFWGSME